MLVCFDDEKADLIVAELGRTGLFLSDSAVLDHNP
jgi:hypothetical protein